jgi:Outer membrane protein beta-barrel domain
LFFDKFIYPKSFSSMKKISLLLWAMCLTVSVGFAQLPFHFGLKGGLNLSKVSGSESSASASGFHVGAFASLNPTKIGVRAELLFSNRGGKATFNSGQNLMQAGQQIGSLLTGDINMWYMDVPVLLDYQLLSLPGLKLNLRTGPQFSLKLSDKIDFGAVTSGNNPINTSEFKFNNSDWGWVFDAGVQVLMLDAGVRYNLGLTKINDFSSLTSINSAYSALSKTEITSSMFQVYVGWKFL